MKVFSVVLVLLFLVGFFGAFPVSADYDLSCDFPGNQAVIFTEGVPWLEATVLRGVDDYSALFELLSAGVSEIGYRADDPGKWNLPDDLVYTHEITIRPYREDAWRYVASEDRSQFRYLYIGQAESNPNDVYVFGLLNRDFEVKEDGSLHGTGVCADMILPADQVLPLLEPLLE
jgi:hypothetical protein